MASDAPQLERRRVRANAVEPVDFMARADARAALARVRLHRAIDARHDAERVRALGAFRYSRLYVDAGFNLAMRDLVSAAQFARRRFGIYFLRDTFDHGTP